MNATTVAITVQIVLTIVFSVAAAANYVMLQSIDTKISKLEITLREWARGLFAERSQVDALTGRIHELELRRITGN